MGKIKVLFRKTKDGEIIAFFPEMTANYGKMMSYMHIGQHGEASIEFYWETKKAAEDEYRPLLEEMKAIYDDFELVVKQKICFKDLYKAWKI